MSKTTRETKAREPRDGLQHTSGQGTPQTFKKAMQIGENDRKEATSRPQRQAHSTPMSEPREADGSLHARYEHDASELGKAEAERGAKKPSSARPRT